MPERPGENDRTLPARRDHLLFDLDYQRRVPRRELIDIFVGQGLGDHAHHFVIALAGAIRLELPP
jgi:hypothetical protein